jgi:hypothetical protein
MGRAIGLGFVVVVTNAVIRWISPSYLYWVEFALLVTVVVGIGAIIAHADAERPVPNGGHHIIHDCAVHGILGFIHWSRVGAA